jgi:hypothetical protein
MCLPLNCFAKHIPPTSCFEKSFSNSISTRLEKRLKMVLQEVYFQNKVFISWKKKFIEYIDKIDRLILAMLQAFVR